MVRYDNEISWCPKFQEDLHVLQHSRFIAVLQIQLGWVSQITPKQFMHHWVDMCKSYHVIILSDGNIIILLYYHITILLYIIYHYIIYIYISNGQVQENVIISSKSVVINATSPSNTVLFCQD